MRRRAIAHRREMQRRRASEGPDRDERRARSLWVVPSAFALAIGLLGSLGVHVPIYGALEALGNYWENAPERNAPPIEFEFELGHPTDAPTSETREQEAQSELVAAAPEPEPEHHEPEQHEPEPEAPPPRPRPERPPEPELPQPAVETPRPAPPPQIDERRAVVQRSSDPTVEAPEDARFIANETNRVEEETQARVTNTLQHHDEPEVASPRETRQSEEMGNADEEVAADLREIEGDDRRRITPDEREQNERNPRERAAQSPTPGPRGEQGDAPGTDSQRARGGRVTDARGGAAGSAGGQEYEEVVVSDGFGSYTVRVPRSPARGTGGGDVGGDRRAGSGRGRSGLGTGAGPAGSRRRGADSGDGERGRPRLGLSWSQFESVYGEEELEAARVARLEERRSSSRGAQRRQRWEQFRAAMENYVPEVRPGNQTALNAAASPFASFLNAMHQRIHREFAERYLSNLPSGTSQGENDPTLQTLLEISVNADGTIHRVGVIATSGNILHDLGAYDSVMRAQPFPRPPAAILSSDGRAWLHWRFDRGPRQCGTFNARPFMLRSTRAER